MADNLDNIFTDEMLSSREFIDEVSSVLSDVTGYQSSPKKTEETIEPEKDEDPLEEVIRKEKVETIKVEKKLNTELSNEEKQRILRKPRTKASISIDDNNDIFCKSWGNYYIEGGEFYEESVLMINEYLEECNKPVKERDFSKFNVGKRNVVEKFMDMNLHRGKISINDFLQDVV